MSTTRRPRTLLIALGLVAAVTLGACGAPSPGTNGRPVMGTSNVTAAEMAGWFHSKGTGGSATVPVQQLAQHFLDEGAAEGVAGDLAFVQAMLETGWLRFSARMPRHHNNFSGIGAVDSGSSSAAFPSAELGVRAQIQHLRAYADPSVNVFTLHRPLIDPRFDLVDKGTAPGWGDFGRGVWATDPGYSARIHQLYDSLLAWADAHPA